MKTDPLKKMTDRERILTLVIREMYRTSICSRTGPARYTKGTGPVRCDQDVVDGVHFAPGGQTVPGDLVVASSSLTQNRWSIGFYVKRVGGINVIREIGSDKLCDYSNETFVPIRGLRNWDILDGDRREFYLKVLAASRKGGDPDYRFRDIKFSEEFNKVDIMRTFRLRFEEKHQVLRAQMVWNKKTTIKAILEALVAAGYGKLKHEDSV